ncbi:molybdenum cofactor guanylyltransferase MobA [Craterilacuibacter sp.]|uniref:molybdenum cofactor guanylyltransferase MobA n=1 Tax=Craterilacuibacter sp. TaxID=2870909 RepID=UPI003F3E0136
MIAGLLLAGGQGLRMGGVDKGQVRLADKALSWHVAERLRPQVDVLLLSANRSLDEYAALGTVVTDLPRWAGQGPLAGLVSVEAALPSTVNYLLVVPCDMPCLPRDLLSVLMSALQAAPYAGAVYAETAEGPQPVILLARRTALATIVNSLNAGQRAVRHWLASIHAIPAYFADAAAFANANDVAALAALETYFLKTSATGPEHA